jgi:hypothetical protein
MDDRNFDGLARALSGASPRRQLLRWVSGLLAGSVAGAVGLQAVEAAACKQTSDCPPPVNPCKRAVCKDGKCVNRPLPKGTACGEQPAASSKSTARDGATAGDETPGGKKDGKKDGSPSHKQTDSSAGKKSSDSTQHQDGDAAGHEPADGDSKKKDGSSERTRTAATDQPLTAAASAEATCAPPGQRCKTNED